MIWFTTKLSDFVWFAFLIRSSGINVSKDSRIRKILEFERPHDRALQFYNIYYFQMKTERSWWHKVTGII